MFPDVAYSPQPRVLFLAKPKSQCGIDTTAIVHTPYWSLLVTCTGTEGFGPDLALRLYMLKDKHVLPAVALPDARMHDNHIYCTGTGETACLHLYACQHPLSLMSLK